MKICIIFICILSSVYAQEKLYLIAAITGEKSGDQFGVSKKIGDLNGDGIDDFVIGSSYNWVNGDEIIITSGNNTILYFKNETGVRRM